MTQARFTQKTVLITGGGSGLGRATAIAFASEGANVVIVGRSQERLNETALLIEQQGRHVLCISCDVTNADAVKQMIQTAVAQFGRLDIALNNAAIAPTPQPFIEIDSTLWNDTVSTNLNGIAFCTKEELLHMSKIGEGIIINVASNLGAHSRRAGFSAYVATKAAVSALTRNVALEAIASNVRINAFSPGPLDTPMSLRRGETSDDRAERLRTSIPIGRVATLAEAANTILWIASAEASFFVGHDFVMDGGATA